MLFRQGRVVQAQPPIAGLLPLPACHSPNSPKTWPPNGGAGVHQHGHKLFSSGRPVLASSRKWACNDLRTCPRRVLYLDCQCITSLQNVFSTRRTGVTARRINVSLQPAGVAHCGMMFFRSDYLQRVMCVHRARSSQAW